MSDRGRSASVLRSLSGSSEKGADAGRDIRPLVARIGENLIEIAEREAVPAELHAERAIGEHFKHLGFGKEVCPRTIDRAVAFPEGGVVAASLRMRIPRETLVQPPRPRLLIVAEDRGRRDELFEVL